MNLSPSRLVAWYIIPLAACQPSVTKYGVASLVASWFCATGPQEVFVVVCFCSPCVCPQSSYRIRLSSLNSVFKLVRLENVIFVFKAISFCKSTYLFVGIPPDELFWRFPQDVSHLLEPLLTKSFLVARNAILQVEEIQVSDSLFVTVEFHFF